MKIAEYSEEIKIENYTHRAKSNIRSSSVWEVIHEIVDDTGNAIDQFYFCTECEAVLYSARSSGSTTKLLRHACANRPARIEMNVNPNDLDKIKRAAAKFICMDLRPFNALECTGLQELVWVATELGKKYPTITRERFFQLFPCRNTVKSIISDGAVRAKNEMKVLFKKSMEQDGLGCTMDMWTDRYKANTYMAMTANVFLIRDDFIEHKRLVFHMGQIADIVKSKEVVKARIIDVFRDFDVSTQEMKEKVTLTTDRYENHNN